MHGKKQAQETKISGYRAGSWDGKQHTVPPRSQLCAATGPQLSEVTQARMSNHIPQVFGAEGSLTRTMLRNSTTRILLENEGMFGNIYLALQFKIKLIFLLPHPTYFVLPFCPP